MKTKNLKSMGMQAEPTGNQRGVALLIVLAMLVLIAALVVGFLGRVSNDQTSTASYSAVVSTRQLADMAVNLVQSQINDASNQGTDKAWASQPGAVRVFDNTGALQNIYRLYSADTMTTSQASDLANDVPAGGASGWAASPAVWVDLNAPVTVQGVEDASGNPMTSYPILDPRDPTNPAKTVSMDGFFLGTTGPSGTVPGTTAVPLATGSAANPAPMPVKWMYALKNGELISPDTGSSGKSITFNNANPRPTKGNPIVGRIAFWTDDETCKVNINTAAGSVNYRPDAKGNFPVTASGKPDLLPAPWDTPRFSGVWEDIKLFGFDQPIMGEYQRYPGHPATTILYNIFSGLGIQMADDKAYGANYNLSYTSAQNKPNSSSNPTTLFKLLPRYNDDFGSNAGTANTTVVNANQSVTQKSDRLYSSVGELLYAANFDSGSNSREGNVDSSAANLSRQQAEVAKFFLTTSSRAPEVNLFGTPRIAVWPIPDPTGTVPDGVNSKDSVRTPYDKLIAFCATTGTGTGAHPYYFVRKDRTSPTVDAATPRNASLYHYLQYLTSSQIPGFGGTFSSKYSQNGERDQILTEMFDYIRCTNPYDHSFADDTTTVRFTPPSGGAGRSEIVPLTIGNTSGLGRVYTVSEVALHIICTADGNSPLGAYVPPRYPQTADGSDNPAGWKIGTGLSPDSANNPSGWKARVSTVVGSANDPLYVSNITEPQFLKNPNGQIVDITGAVATSATPPRLAFKANPTLSTTGVYKDSATAAGQSTADGLNNWLTPLTTGQRKLQAMLLFEMASPMNGYDWMGADVRLNVTRLDKISIAGVSPFPATPGSSSGANSNGNGYVDGSSNLSWSQNGLSTWGGLSGFRALMNNAQNTSSWGYTSLRYNGWSGKGQLVGPSAYPGIYDTMGTSGNGYADAYVPLASANVPYRPVSNPFTAPSSGTLAISGGCTVTLQIPTNTGTGNYGVGSFNSTFQTLNVDFSKVPQPTAPPALPLWGVDYGSSPTRISHAPDWWNFDNRIGWDTYKYAPYVLPSSWPNPPNQSPYLGWACMFRTDKAAPAAGAWTYAGTHDGTITQNGIPCDVVRSVFAKDGDYRLTAAKSVVHADGNDFVSLPGTGNLAHMLMDATQGPRSIAYPGCDSGGKLAAGINYSPLYAPKVPTNPLNTNIQIMGDWDNGTPGMTDGAFANWPDDGNIYSSSGVAPYFNGQGWASDVTTIKSYFTPNRIIPSPVMFGSLPTGVAEGITWRTLLFRPQINRPNDASGPKDYLFLDLFNMPVVEPYAISEPFSTAGKVNMNYQIVPFTYITRDTAIRAVLGSELVARIPAAAASKYPWNTAPYTKLIYPTTGTSQSSISVPSGPAQARLPINLDEVNGTLRQFQDKFAGWNIFRSAAEICSLYLPPKDSVNPSLYKDWFTAGPPYNAADNSWYGSDFAGVGDNLRERPYATIYPRLTTKSNAFTVHFTVQSLKNTSPDPEQWNEDRGVILGEYRGSTTLERYLDPNDPNIPDYGDGTDPTAKIPIDKYYKWRVVANRRFYP